MTESPTAVVSLMATTIALQDTRLIATTSYEYPLQNVFLFWLAKND